MHLRSFFSMWISFFPYPVYEETILAPLYCLCSLSKINWLCLCGSVSGLFILFHWETCLFFHQHHSVLIIIVLYFVLKLGCGSLPRYFYFNIVLTILSLLSFRIDFRNTHKITCCVFFLYFLLWYRRLANNVVIVSGEQQRDSVIHIHVSILPQTSTLSRLPHNTERSSMYYTVGPWRLSTLNILSGVFIGIALNL